MKKFLCILLAILAVVSLAAGAGYGLAWYRSNHVFIGGNAYYIHEEELDLRSESLGIKEYELLKTVMPDCDITWMAPFQGKTVSSDSKTLTVSAFTQEDMDILLAYFPELETLDATACGEYALLEQFQKSMPGCNVVYQVDLGGKSYPLDAQELTLNNGDYTLDTLVENLKYLHGVTALTLRTPELTLEQIGQIRAAYADVEITCTVEILGKEYDDTTTALDLSALTSADVAGLGEKLAMLPLLETVELMDASGASSLTKEDVKALVTMAPNAAFHYTFDFYGETLSTDTEEVSLKNIKIGDAGEADLRLALELMPKCKRFVLDNCGFSDEVLAKVRDDFRQQTKIVWRIWYGSRGTCLTDVEIFLCVYNLEKNNKSVKYCEDVVFMDIGHNDYLTDISFVAHMPKLRAAIVSGSSIRDLEPFRSCTELEFLETVFCGYIEDLSPLEGLTNLKMLNVGNTKVEDLSPLDGLNLTHFAARRNGVGTSRVSRDEQARFMKLHPDCWAEFDGDQPYGTGWRYEKDNITFNPYYQMLRILFRYDLDPHNPTQECFYLSQVDEYLADLDKKKDTPRTFSMFEDAVADAWADWKRPGEETAETTESTESTESTQSTEAAENNQEGTA